LTALHGAFDVEVVEDLVEIAGRGTADGGGDATSGGESGLDGGGGVGAGCGRGYACCAEELDCGIGLVDR